jgi:hypothetical protein
MTELKLRADIEVFASAVQDAIFQIGQTRYDAPGRSFTLRMSRYMHEAKSPQRIESGLRFDGVMSVQSTGVDTAKSEAYAVILGLEFETGDAPAGQFNLLLAGGGVIRLAVEAIDLTLADVGDPKPTKRIPKHDV